MDNEDQSTTDRIGPGLYTLPEAAALTGLSTEALRLRIRRGKLASEKDNQGRVRIRLTTADLDEIGQRRSTLTDLPRPLSDPDSTPSDQRSTESDHDGTTSAWLSLTDRLLDRLEDAQIAVAEARERAAKSGEEAAHLRGEAARFEAMAKVAIARADQAEAALERLRARGWWARLRNR